MRRRRSCQPPASPAAVDRYLEDRMISRLVRMATCEGGRLRYRGPRSSEASSSGDASSGGRAL